MPPARSRPSEVAVEAKRVYHPYIDREMPECPARSVMIPDSSQIPVADDRRACQRLRVAVIDGDPIDVALDWYLHASRDSARLEPPKIPVVNMANEKRAGGDWESGHMAPEECFSRRSNLVQALVTPFEYPSPSTPHYPIPHRGGIYSPSVVVYRDGPEFYQIWQEFRSLPVISVAPVRRPKLDESGSNYSFEQERDLMMEKMRTVLRLAAMYRHVDLCLGAFGCGPEFRNPVREVAKMWKTLLFEEAEFQGTFENIVFAIPSDQPGIPEGGIEELEVFKQVFNPSSIFHTIYR
ncbi:hypothetical protein EJ05DRAFT_239834 [Pseudovirgaria hyperparasitica]|uniref:Microbial-type PARG catalytic domain-containing protein n=1 Tax=Pseudovirgaria hyperparasitica TaxID=470096 RepID=A0A6A6WDN9_9PEZI|nr:uncharacterized protein EJ05DRAFT_239834 [Pseudovirgaria hyperparasitica]KAF2760685.1 hypothetical protein EJ05DRAFT_239834 [Pseudovirgaria hyperparasitica]